MLGRRAVARIVFEEGGRERDVALRGPVFLVGSGDDCQMTVKAPFVDPCHIELREHDEQWSLVNRSINGTLINGIEVATGPLHDGDWIEIGEGVRLRFAAGEAAAVSEAPSIEALRTGSAEDQGTTPPAMRMPTLDRLGPQGRLYAGIAMFYVVLGVGLTVASQLMADDPAVRPLPWAPFGFAVEITDEELDAAGVDMLQAKGSERCDEFIAALQTDSGWGLPDANARSGLAARAESELRDAWRLELRGQHEGADVHYRRVLDLMPNAQYCAARFARARLARKRT